MSSAEKSAVKRPVLVGSAFAAAEVAPLSDLAVTNGPLGDAVAVSLE